MTVVQPLGKIIRTDPMWEVIRDEAVRAAAAEPLLAGFLHSSLLKHDTLEQALSLILADKLGNATVPVVLMHEILLDAFAHDAALGAAARADIRAFCERDPACDRFLLPLLYFKGLHALQGYRATHWLWNNRRRDLALYLQSRISETFGVDIHPAARIGTGILVDHATALVIGETAVVGDNVSMLHEVTLGGTGKDSGDRHPKVGCGVLLGAGAKVLGNVTIGSNAKVGAGSVVLDDVPDNCTVAGVPAVVVGGPCSGAPALDMDHTIPSHS